MAALTSLRSNVDAIRVFGVVRSFSGIRQLRKACLLFLLYLVLGLNPVSADPNLTVRFSNPQFNCATAEYCLDVEFQSDQAGYELFGMNVRLFYDDVILELVDFRGFLGGYGPIAPNPPGNTYSATAALRYLILAEVRTISMEPFRKPIAMLRQSLFQQVAGPSFSRFVL